MSKLEDRIAELERRVKELERRPRAGRPAERLNEAMAWLEKRLSPKKKGERSRDIIRAAVKDMDFSEVLVRKASIRLGVTKEGGIWLLQPDNG